MPQSGSVEMSKHNFSVSYSGSSRTDDHTMDVEALAPALLAFGKLIREANHEFNGKKSFAKVLVNADFENHCFYIDFNAVISYFDQLKTLLGQEPVKTAKEVLEWVGLIKDHKMTAMTLIQFLSWKRGRKVEDASEIKETIDKDSRGLIQVRVVGDNSPVTINQNIYNLSNNPKALRAVRDSLSPIGRDGFENFEVRDGKNIASVINPQATQAIISSCNLAIEEAGDPVPDVDETTAWLSVYSPVYDQLATNWRFTIGPRQHVYIDISETKIAENALTRGGAMADDAYQVRLEIKTAKDKNGKPLKPTYKILEVIKFVPASPAMQGSLFEERA